ncbi:MAG: tetraacyldisaccharide 4'-kinase [Bacteroidota bacterium]
MNRLRILLVPLSLLYGVGVALRNWFFEIGIFRVADAGVPVVSVGNLSVGGTGKTPFVELIVSRLASSKQKIAVLSRGYGRRTRGYVVVSNGAQRCAEAWTAGDEPAQLAEKLQGVVVAVDEDRVRAARNVVADFGVSLIVLDDGFQHRYLRRDLDIVLVTADDALAGDFLLPAGNRREPPSSLRRADIVVLSQCNDKSHFEKASAKLASQAGSRMVGVQTRFKAVRRASSNEVWQLEKLKGQRVVAFSGIGRPQSFDTILKEMGLDVVRHYTYPDHHWYSKDDIAELTGRADTKAFVTTEKDVSRLRGSSGESFLEKFPIFYVEIQQAFIAGDEVLTSALSRVLNKR